MAKARHLHIVDADTGETLEHCPHCKERDRELARMRTIIVNLRADKEAEARENELWPQAKEIFDFWRLATGHKRARWTADRFWVIERFLRTEGYEDCRRALCGLFASEWHMKRGRHAKREGSVFDEFERVFETQAVFERWRDSLPPPSQETQEFFAWFEALPG